MGTREAAEAKWMATAVQRRVDDYCNGSIESKNYTDLEHILEVFLTQVRGNIGVPLLRLGRPEEIFFGGGVGSSMTRVGL